MPVFGQLPYGGERFTHDARKPQIDFIFGPEKAREILHPFEITDGHPTCVGDHVRNYQHPILVQNIVGSRRGRTVCTFQNDSGANLVCVHFGNLLLQRCGNQNIAVDSPKLRSVTEFFHTGKSRDTAMYGDMCLQCGNV